MGHHVIRQVGKCDCGIVCHLAYIKSQVPETWCQKLTFSYSSADE